MRDQQALASLLKQVDIIRRETKHALLQQAASEPLPFQAEIPPQYVPEQQMHQPPPESEDFAFGEEEKESLDDMLGMASDHPTMSDQRNFQSPSHEPTSDPSDF